MISCGALGRGASPGNASAELVYTFEYPASVEQSEFALSHAQSSNERSAAKRLWPGLIIALTSTSEIAWALVPARSIVTCWPAMLESVPSAARPSADQLVVSVSSIASAWPVPVPDAVAPAVVEATLIGIRTVIAWEPAFRFSLNRKKPWPLLTTRKSYLPGTNEAAASRLTSMPEFVVAGSVSAIGCTRP